MNTANYFTWTTDPVAFTIPEFSLPFSVSIYGLVLAAILFYFGMPKLREMEKNGQEPSGPKVFGLLFIAFLIGQIPFFFIDSPSINSFGPIQPHWYGVMFACAFIFGYTVGGKMYSDAGRSQEEMDKLLIYVLVATIIGARLGHVFFYDFSYYMRNPLEIILPFRFAPEFQFTGFSGLASHGAAVGIIIAMYLYAKRTAGLTFFWVADRVVPGVAIGGMFIRIGNFFNSEILGDVSELPWAVVFAVSPHLSETERLLPRHPSMLYESLLCIFVLAILWFIYKKYENNPPKGSLFGTFLVTLFTGRILIEFTKLPQSEVDGLFFMNMGQILSIPLVLYGIWLLWKKVDWSSSYRVKPIQNEKA